MFATVAAVKTFIDLPDLFIISFHIRVLLEFPQVRAVQTASLTTGDD